MTPTQKDAALTLFRNIAQKSKAIADAIDAGDCDDVWIDNDFAGDMVHTERCVNALYSVFVETRSEVSNGETGSC